MAYNVVFATSKAFKYVLLVTLSAAVLVSGFRFDVGENRGWTIPTGNEPETYNEWAAKNRFHIGDSVYFKYQNDSVLVVSPASYLNCNISNPFFKFEDGNTVFQFDRSGFFYFISGTSDHCKLGQKITIRVMHPSEIEGPSPSPSLSLAPALAPAPAPEAGGESGGASGQVWVPPRANSSIKPFVISYFMTALAALIVFLYLFV